MGEALLPGSVIEGQNASAYIQRIFKTPGHWH